MKQRVDVLLPPAQHCSRATNFPQASARTHLVAGEIFCPRRSMDAGEGALWAHTNSLWLRQEASKRARRPQPRMCIPKLSSSFDCGSTRVDDYRNV